jgi:hypothetical protein
MSTRSSKLLSKRQTSATEASASTTSSPSFEVPLPHSDLGVPISDERKDRINKELLNKEVRVLDFTVLLNNAAMLKKEKE